MHITFFGTTTLLFDGGTDQILFDCHFTRPSLLQCGIGTITSDAHIVDRVLEEYRIDRLKAVFVSHSHHDHVLDAPHTVLRTGAKLYGSATTLNIARGNGVPEKQLVWFQHDAVFEVGEFQIRVLKSVHSRPTRFNNNLGETIEVPMKYPAKMSQFKEGGSYDFLVEHRGMRFLIRPSYNFLEHQLDTIRADVLIQGITGLAKDKEEIRKRFFRETIEKVRPKVVIPVHWDHFFTPLFDGTKNLPMLFGDSEGSKRLLKEYCEMHGIRYVCLNNLEAIDF